MMRYLFLLAFAAALPLVGAQAADRPVLRGEISATRAVITVGDFFDNAGPHANQPLFRAPDLGRTGTVPALEVMRRASAAGLANADSAGLTRVVVHRAALTVGPDELAGMIRDALVERAGIDDPNALEISYSSQLPTLTADPAALEPVALSRLSYATRSGRFDALFSVQMEDRKMTVAVAGVARKTAEVVTFARRVSRGDVVSAHDLETVRVATARLRDDTVLDASTIIGMAVRRPQAPGHSLNARDFEEPLAVERRSKVIITYKIGGLKLTVQGEAMADAAKGEVIDVLNIQSHRVVQAVATGPGRVSVRPRTARIARLEEANQ